MLLDLHILSPPGELRKVAWRYWRGRIGLDKPAQAAVLRGFRYSNFVAPSNNAASSSSKDSSAGTG